LGTNNRWGLEGVIARVTGKAVQKRDGGKNKERNNLQKGVNYEDDEFNHTQTVKTFDESKKLWKGTEREKRHPKGGNSNKGGGSIRLIRQKRPPAREGNAGAQGTGKERKWVKKKEH